MSFRDNFTDLHPVVKLIIDIGASIIFGLVFFAIIIFTVAHLNGFSISDFTITASSGADMSLFKELQMIYSVSFFMLPPLVIALFYNRSSVKFFGLDKTSKITTYFAVILLVVSLLPFINWTMQINSAMHLPSSMQGIELLMKSMEDKAKVLTEQMLYTPLGRQLLVNIIVVALIPAIGEELFFRGLLQKHFIEWFKSPIWGIIVTAFIFSAFHLQFFSFLPRFILGIMLGYLYFISKSLWINILAHFTNNALAVISFFILARKGMSPETLDTWGTSAAFVAASLIVGGAIFSLILKKEKANHLK